MIPVPSALLVEHPAVPVPGIGRAIGMSMPAGDVVAAGSLSRSDRFRMALQLTAAAALLGEFDLWPGRASLRNALYIRTPSGLEARLARFPMPMSRVFSRLGGGEAAASKTRDAVLAAVAEAVGLPRSTIDARSGAPGFFLEGAIARQLRELKRPLDPCTARALWAFRWDGLPSPTEGETNYWNVPDRDLARRLAAGLWASVRRSGGQAWLWDAADPKGENAPVPTRNGTGMLIVAGDVSAGELAAVSRWTEHAGRSAVIVGTFPRGWYPLPPPGFDSRKLFQHIAIAGLPLEEARTVIERRKGRIDPLDQIERRTLTDAARWGFVTPPARRSGAGAAVRRTDVEALLALSPDGLPPGFVVLHSGLPIDRIEDQRSQLPVIVSDGWWRLAQPHPLEPNPLHSEIALLFEPGDPRRLLHGALGSGDSEELEGWARSMLDRLQGVAVRDLLSAIAPGSLGIGISSLVAEACLSVLDLAGARRAMQSIPPHRGRALSTWAANLDPLPGSRRSLVGEERSEANQRAVAEATLLVANEERRHRSSNSPEIRSIIDHAISSVPPTLQRRFEIELAWIENPELFGDSRWRHRVAGRHTILRAQLSHRRALVLMNRGRPRSARRLLRTLLDDRMGPGLQGAVEQDLGAAALDDGRSRVAEGHQLRAYRLLQAAGFRHVTRDVLFNLAVADIDLLEVARAERRLQQLADDDPTDLFVDGERVRLALATGDRKSFETQLKAFTSRAGGDDRFAEGLHLLSGVAALFDGNLARAEIEFGVAGQEGEAWSDLVASLVGGPHSAVEPDGWGVTIAADIVRGVRSGDRREVGKIDAAAVTPQHAFGFALAELVGGTILPLTAATRASGAAVLRNAGMNGWAAALAGRTAEVEDAMEAIAEIVERGGPEGLDSDLTGRLLNGLGVDGLEIREASQGRTVWRAGSGSPGTEIRRRRFVLVPLGNEVRDDPAWRLLTTVLEAFASIPTQSPDPEVEKTGFYGVSSAARMIRRELHELGPTHLPVLLVGETGVGKEVAAQALHKLSGRRGAFVAVNLAAIPSNLLEAELFGSVKGAFTGADRSRQGLVTAADGGTLFLDEIGDLDPPLQVKLLRFLETQEFRAVGSTRPLQVDVRIVSATNRDLGRAVRDGTFRQDLYYRIAAPPFEIPPLRERREDIGILRDIFQERAISQHGLAPCAWSKEADAALRSYGWPGNVRELRQTVEVAMVRAGGGVVRLDHLSIEAVEPAVTGTWAEAQDAFRRRFLRAALDRNGGNRSATARELGISRQALLYHLRNLGLMDT